MRPEDAVSLCQELIRIPSTSGDEGGIAVHLASLMRRAGFTAVSVDESGSLLGEVQGARPGAALLLDGHLDTVPVVDRAAWSVDPFGGTLHDGKVWGRGATDMKGGVAAMIAAIASLAEGPRDFPGRVVFSGTVSEETLGWASFLPVVSRLRPKYVVIGEPSNLVLCRGQRGRFEFRVVTHGRAAHAAFPERGVNAVLTMLPVIARLDRLGLPVDPFLGKGVMSLVDIVSDPFPSDSMIPVRCTASYERRLVASTESRESLLQEMNAIFGELQAQQPLLRAEVLPVRSEGKTYTNLPLHIEKYAASWTTPEMSPLVAALRRGMEDVGTPPSISYYGFSTNGGCSAGMLGIETVGFGPGCPANAHMTDEHVDAEQLIAACRVYQRMIAHLLPSLASDQRE